MKLHSTRLTIPLLALAMVFGGFAVPNVAQAAKAVCGDEVRAGGEKCDGTDSAACPGQCKEDCTCPSVKERIEALEALLASVSLEDGGTTLRFTGVNLEVVGGGALAINAGSVAITSVSTLDLDAGTNLNLDAGFSLNLDAGGILNLDAGGILDAQASLIKLNGGPLPAARQGDLVVNGVIATGSPTVLIGN